MADKSLTNPTGAFGYTTLQTELWQSCASFQTSAAVSAGRVVALNTLGQVAHAATNNTASLCMGISINAISSGAAGLIVVEGYAQGNADGAIAAGDVLKRSTNTAGFVMTTATPTATERVGVAINASASNLVDVWVTK